MQAVIVKILLRQKILYISNPVAEVGRIYASASGRNLKKIFFAGGVLVKTPVNMLLHPVDHA